MTDTLFFLLVTRSVSEQLLVLSFINPSVSQCVDQSVGQTERQLKRWHHPSTEWKMQQRRGREGRGVLPRWYHCHRGIGWGQRWCHTSPSCSPELWTEAGFQRGRQTERKLRRFKSLTPKTTAEIGQMQKKMFFQAVGFCVDESQQRRKWKRSTWESRNRGYPADFSSSAVECIFELEWP